MLDDIKKTLWATADKLRTNMDAAEYKHIVLGLIFLKYISDTFQIRRDELTRRFTDINDDYYIPDADTAMMCQHFSGHMLTRLCKPPHNLLVINNR